MSRACQRSPAQHGESGLEHPPLRGAVVRRPEGMPEGELDTHDARRKQAFRDVGHHRDQHRRDAGVLQQFLQRIESPHQT